MSEKIRRIEIVKLTEKLFQEHVRLGLNPHAGYDTLRLWKRGVGCYFTQIGPFCPHILLVDGKLVKAENLGVLESMAWSAARRAGERQVRITTPSCCASIVKEPRS